MNSLSPLTASDDQLAHGSRPVTPRPIPQNDAERLLGLLTEFWNGLDKAIGSLDPDTLYEIGNLMDGGEGPAIGENDSAWLEATRAMVKRKADYAYEQWAEERRSAPNWPSREMGTYQGG